MKKIFVSFIGVIAALLFTGCNMGVPLTHNTDGDKPMETVQDVTNALHGAMEQFGGYRFMGRNYVATGDFCGDIANASASTGHFLNMSGWTFDENSEELKVMWQSGYVIIVACTRGIEGANHVMAKVSSDEEKQTLTNCLQQFYGLKAATYFYLSNIFCKAYSVEHAPGLGLILVKDEIIKPEQKVERSTLEDTYKYILELINKAYTYDNQETSPFFINPINLKAIEAKVRLYMRDYAGALAAADAVVTSKAYKKVNLEEKDYLAMWQTVASVPEDVFTIVKSDNDNLSANALNTLYGSYKGTIDLTFIQPLFAAGDYRAKLFDEAKSRTLKYEGTPTAQAVSNIHVIRLSEVYLIKAEAAAQLGNVAEAQTALLYTAKRNPAITAVADLPSTKEDLLKFIAEERIRELFTEGNRLYDLRRTEATATIAGKANFKPYNSVFPIPASEINAGFMTQQNDDWASNLPK